MKLWKLAATVAVGVWASGSGVMQVQAANFAYQVDFLDKEVSNFDNFKQTFNANTYDLNGKLDWTWSGTYYFNTTTNLTVDMLYRVQYRINGVGAQIPFLSVPLPDFVVRTNPTLYTAFGTAALPEAIVLALINDDTTFVQFTSTITFRTNNFIGNTLTLENYTSFFNIYYDFDTTYLFNYFLSDQQFVSREQTRPATWIFNSTFLNFLEYVYTTAGNDTFFIENSLQVGIGTNRKKYAINVDDVYFRGQSIGAQFRTSNSINVDRLTPLIADFENLTYRYNYFYLNSSNYQQPLADVPQFTFTEQDCGSFLALNVGCFINNGLAYVVNDAPIISDIFTLLNTGMQLGGQAFSVFANFSNNNLFGVLILGGAGLTAVRWFLKQDQ